VVSGTATETQPFDGELVAPKRGIEGIVNESSLRAKVGAKIRRRHTYDAVESAQPSYGKSGDFRRKTNYQMHEDKSPKAPPCEKKRHGGREHGRLP